MLILAGVSLNAIIGDNGIITNAQNANLLTSCAVLSEYLNEVYVEDITEEKIAEENSSKTKLENFLTQHPSLFFFNNTYDYILVDSTDSEGNVVFLKLRLIRKVNLNDDVKKQLVGGDANNDNLDAYLNLQDVYGVTDDLQVYYCQNGIESAIGADFKNSSVLNAALVMYDKDTPVSKAIAQTLGNSSTKDATLAEIRNMSTLTISGDSGISNLKFLSDMPKITQLTFENYTGSFEGIGSLRYLTYIYIDNSGKNTNINYQDLRYASNLMELYFYMPNNSEISKMCTEMANGTYSNLKTLGLFGYTINRKVNEIYYSNSNLRGNRSELTTLENLDLLNQTTKEAVKVLYVNNNKLSTLKGIENFKGVQSLYLNNNDIANSGLATQISEMKSLTTLYCGWSTIPTSEFNNISNSTIRYLSCPGNGLTSLNVLTNFTNLTQLQCTNNTNISLNNDVIQKIVKCSTYYMDSVYSTKLALANIGWEVYLGADADDSDLELLRGKTVVNYLEIPGNTRITDSKLQSILPTLTNLTVLIADSSNLASLNFIGTNSKLQWISICGTSITDLSKLNNCSELRALRINNSSINLKPYSRMISNMCNRGASSEFHLKCGVRSMGGINAPVSVLNTLNGTATNPNTDFTVFSDYCGWDYSLATVDFTYTSLNTVKIIYASITIKVPTSFTTFNATECAVGRIDYTNITSANWYNAVQIASINTSNFTGYKSVFSNSDVTSIIGTNTETLLIGSYKSNYEADVTKPHYTRDIASYVTKAPNLTNLGIYSQLGINDISILAPLKLTILRINYCSLTNLNVPKNTPTSNLSNNLKTLIITNSYLTALDGLDNLPQIETLDLSANKLENYVTVTDSVTNTTKTMKTSKYIVDSLPNLKTVTLAGNTELTDFEDLTKAGFTETTTNSRVFTRP